MRYPPLDIVKLTAVMLFFLFATIGCTDTAQSVQNNEENNEQKKNKPASGYTDTLTISSAAAIFYNPGGLQLEKIRAVTDSMIFESMQHDCFYQQRNARLLLQKNWSQIKIIEAINVRYLLFQKPGSAVTIIDLDTQNDPCGIFFFDTKKDPHFVDMTNVETELGFYFTRQ
jgi:hypothetical protein